MALTLFKFRHVQAHFGHLSGIRPSSAVVRSQWPPMNAGKACCVPSRQGAMARDQAPVGDGPAVEAAALVPLTGGEFLMGAALARHAEDGETPVRTVRVSPFEIAACSVTNADFTRFVNATGYCTTAEQLGRSFVFYQFLAGPDGKPSDASVAIANAPWWRDVAGACWHAPEGPGSTIDTRMNHPVVHVSWFDASAYCQWAGQRLPTETEWEFAARGGLVRKPYPWGSELTPNGTHQCNIWQGDFPLTNSAEDGYVGTAPVDSYAPNGYGLFNMVGNVWEWCADPFSRSHKPVCDDSALHNRVIRGGSYLCHISYCVRYRTSSRSANSADSTSGNLGFRVARG